MFNSCAKQNTDWSDPGKSDCRFKGNIKPSRSVDFSRMSIRTSLKEAPHAASRFSRRAARGSYSKDLFARDATRKTDDCSLGKVDYASSFADIDPLSTNSWSTDDASNTDHSTTQLSISLPRFSLARLSVIFLAFATITDLALTKMSTDVERPRSSLGSAAFESVTNTLSPILPFAGGLDLRRDDYWSTSDGDWFGTLQSVASQVSDAFARKDGDDAAKVDDTPFTQTVPEKKGKQARSKRNKSQHVSAVSASKPFVSLDAIAELTLGEVAETFRYATESSENDFNESKFFQRLLPRVKKVIYAMRDAVDRSRGQQFGNWVRVSESMVEEMDALKFCAAMRVFAEWRLLRQVPEGYKGFSVGMSLGHKDVVQNLVKIERGVHNWMDFKRDLCSESFCVQLQTPTLRELLSYEVDTGTHTRLPRLKEISAGMGLLWVRRQMAYQTHIFDNLQHLDHRFTSMKDAVGAAYTEVYDKYHGWAVQKIFNYSFQAAPEAEKILRYMNPHRLHEVMNEGPSTVNSSTADLRNDYTAIEAEKDQNPVEQFLNHIGSEWDKLATNVVKIIHHKKHKKLDVRGGGVDSSQEPDEAYVTQEMIKDAHQHIAAYLQVANPILNNLASMFDELNMDDPTRV